jgi:acyl-CoA reductase-like NAD-dependent aldehyde dehydrogenase
MVAAAVAAQEAFQFWTEPRVDALLRDVAEAIARRAEDLAVASVEETGMGVAADKMRKITFASRNVCAALLDHAASGVLHTDEQRRVTELASPMGVVLGLIPVTNPVPTLVFKALICLKSRNALILSCHRNALGVGCRAAEIIRTVMREHGAPADLIQCIQGRTSRALTSMFMMHKDVSFILATGGPSMVRAAYSSGTPAIGVGPGNAPVLICSDADPDTVAGIVIDSKGFDNGVICGSENNLIVEKSVKESFLAGLEKSGAAVLKSDEITRLSDRIFDASTGHLRREVVGQSAEHILHLAGIHRPDPIRLIVVPLGREDCHGPFGREKLAPILSLFVADDEADGFALCHQILANGGKGHTAIIHTRDEDRARRFGVELPVSRVLVNCPGSQGCIGLANGLIPSLTLGCGTFGGTSTTDNVSYSNLLNIKRVAQAL